MAAIESLPSGAYRVRYAVGSRRRSRTFTTETEARDFKDEIEDRLGPGPQEISKGVRYDEYAAEWFTNQKQLVKPSTAQRYNSLLNVHVIPEFGFMLLDEISPSAIRTWQTSMLADGRAPRTVAMARTVFSMSTNAALVDGRIERNPFQGVRGPKIVKKRITILAEPEVKRLAHAIKPRFRAMVILSAYMGLRIGELTALSPDDIDFQTKKLRIAKTRFKLCGEPWQEGPAKTPNSVRELTMPPFLVEELRKHITAGHSSADFLFTGIHGGAVQPDYFRTFPWRKAIGETGLAPLRVHDLRHTAISLWIREGASPNLIAYMAGHGSVAFVLDTYGHLSGDEDEELAVKFDARVIS